MLTKASRGISRKEAYRAVSLEEQLLTATPLVQDDILLPPPLHVGTGVSALGSLSDSLFKTETESRARLPLGHHELSLHLSVPHSTKMGTFKRESAHLIRRKFNRGRFAFL